MKRAAWIVLAVVSGAMAAGAQEATSNQQSSGVATLEQMGPGVSTPSKDSKPRKFAFNPSATQGSLTIVQVSPPQPACPVSMNAKQRGMTDMVRVRDGQQSQPPSGPTQRLRLTLTNTQSGDIVSAKVTVHGFKPSARVNYADLNGAGSNGSGSNSSGSVYGANQVWRQVTVDFAGAGGKAVTGELIVPGMTAVTRIDLDSVTYLDGATQEYGAERGCRVQPDPLVLVN
jgi:hypothetical protein